MNLSPLTIDRVKHGSGLLDNVSDKPSVEALSRYRRWACPRCRDTYARERDAEACCPRDAEEVFVDPDSGEQFDSMSELRQARADRQGDLDSCACPVCRATAKDMHDASNCCLWKDLDVAQRYAVANAVEAGATWAEALGLADTAAR